MRLGALSGSVVIQNSPNAVTLLVPLVALPTGATPISDFGQVEQAWINAGMPFDDYFNVPGYGSFMPALSANQNQRTSVQNGTSIGDSIESPGEGGYTGGVTLNYVYNPETKIDLWPTQTGPNTYTGTLLVGSNRGNALTWFDYLDIAVISVGAGAIAGAAIAGAGASAAGTSTVTATDATDSTTVFDSQGNIVTGPDADTTAGSGIGSGSSVSPTTTATGTSASDTLPGDTVTTNGSSVEGPTEADATTPTSTTTSSDDTSLADQDNITINEPKPIDVTPQQIDITPSDDSTAISPAADSSSSSSLLPPGTASTLQTASSGLSIARLIGNLVAAVTGGTAAASAASETNPGGAVAETASGSLAGLAIMAVAAYLLFEG